MTTLRPIRGLAIILLLARVSRSPATIRIVSSAQLSPMVNASRLVLIGQRCCSVQM